MKTHQEALAKQVGGYPRIFLSVGVGVTLSGTGYVLVFCFRVARRKSELKH